MEIKDDDNNFIGAISEDEFNYILAYVDLTTGEQYVVNLKKDYRVVLATISNLEIKEIVVGTSFDANLITYLKDNLHVVFSYNNDDETSIEMEALFKYLKDPRQMRCVARLYNYLVDTQKRSLDYFQPVINRLSTKILGLDHSSRTNLELVKNLKGEGSYGTLYWLLNKTSTSMGARLLKSEIEEPSSDILEINKRLDRVEALITNFMVRSDLKKSLESIYDLDRLIGRVGFNSCSGREMLQLKKSLQMVPGIKELLSKLPEECFKEIVDGLGDFNELTDTLERAISIDCPLTITEGGIFNKGYNSQLDELIEISTHGKNWLLDIEQKEKEKTGIKNLKIGYNRVFGYYIEISNSFLNQIDPSWGYIRKQTLTTGERFITEDLKNAESKLLTAQEQRISLENKLFHELRDYVAGFTSQIQALGKAISKLDVSCALAIVSSEGNYVRPTFNEQKIIDVKEARHPVIEKVMPEKEFVSNDYYMDQDTEVLIITGPNMGGKSTYMREFALLVIMAQIGCFVAAKEANLYLFDNIFTRIGASDDLIKGQSTFMVEMSEVNNALKNATENSLILFDEIEKAHPDVFNILLQVLDDGHITDSQGRKVDFKNTIIIMTSNMGSSYIQSQMEKLHGSNKEEVIEETKKEVMNMLKKTIRPEFLNRIDETIMFLPLNEKEIKQIVLLQIKGVQKMLAENGVELQLTEGALNFLSQVGYDPEFGARPVKRAIQRYLLNDLSKKLLSQEVDRSKAIIVDADGDGLVFRN